MAGNKFYGRGWFDRGQALKPALAALMESQRRGQRNMLLLAIVGTVVAGAAPIVVDVLAAQRRERPAAEE